MALALSGPSGTGKTTLAKALAEKTGMTFVPSRAAMIFRNLGFTQDQELSFDERLTLQETILLAHMQDVQQAGGHFVTDRSAICMAAYTLADLGPRATAGNEDRLLAYVDRCLTQAGRLYSGIVVVQPGIAYEITPDRPSPSKARQELINALIMAFIRDPRCGCDTYALRRDMTDLDDRVSGLLSLWNSLVKQASEECAHAWMN